MIDKTACNRQIWLEREAGDTFGGIAARHGITTVRFGDSISSGGVLSGRTRLTDPYRWKVEVPRCLTIYFRRDRRHHAAQAAPDGVCQLRLIIFALDEQWPFTNSRNT